MDHSVLLFPHVRDLGFIFRFLSTVNYKDMSNPYPAVGNRRVILRKCRAGSECKYDQADFALYTPMFQYFSFYQRTKSHLMSFNQTYICTTI